MQATVLIVNDQHVVGSALSAMLRACGHRTAVVSSAAECREWLRSHRPPDLALVALRSPDSDGSALLRRLDEGGWRFPVALLYGPGTPRAPQPCSAGLRCTALHGPVTPAQLRELVEQALLRPAA